MYCMYVYVCKCIMWIILDFLFFNAIITAMEICSGNAQLQMKGQ